MRPIPRRAALALPALLPSLAARAQDAAWRPAGSVRIVVPAAAGGTTDIMGRLLAAHLARRWGVQVVADNRTGAGGIIGSQEVARSRPDGLMMLTGNIGPQAIAYALFRDLPYGPDSLIPVSSMIRGPNVLVVHPSLPVRTAAEFVAYLRANPGRLSYGSPGVGQSPHLSAVWLLQLVGGEATHIPYRGAAPAMVELLAGNIQFMTDNLTTAIQQIRGGQVRALGVTSADRNAQLPEVPALREVVPELAGYDVNTWFGMFLPAGTPGPVVRALNVEIRGLLEAPETRARFEAMGGLPQYLSPENYAAFVHAEAAKWAAVIRRDGLRMDVG